MHLPSTPLVRRTESLAVSQSQYLPLVGYVSLVFVLLRRRRRRRRRRREGGEQ
jgi:hypothetical protein